MSLSTFGNKSLIVSILSQCDYHLNVLQLVVKFKLFLF